MLEGYEHQHIPSTSPGESGNYIRNGSNVAKLSYVAGRRDGNALRVEEDGLTATWLKHVPITAGTNTIVFSMWIKVTPPPSGTSSIVKWGSSGAGPQPALIQVTSTGALSARFATGTTQTTAGTYNDGNWHLLEAKVVTVSPTHTLDWAVDGVAQTQATLGANTFALDEFLMGSTTATDNATCLYDDVVVSVTAADYPMGGFHVTSYVPNGDGSHNNPNGYIINEDSTATNYWQRLDTVPPSMLTFVKQAGSGNSMFIEVTFENTALAGPTLPYVSLISFSSIASTTSTAIGLARAVDALGNAVGSTIPISNTYGVAFPRQVQLPSMTVTEFNALRGRVGYSSDVSPQPHWHLMMLMVAEEDSGLPTTVTKDHTTNAIVKVTSTEDHTTNAIVRKTLTRTHTTNATVLKTLTKTHTTNAFIIAAFTKTHTTNAIVKKTISKTHTTNAIVRKTLTRTHTSDAYLGASLLGQAKTHSTDALIIATLIEEHDTDATILKAIKPFHRTDAIVRRTFTRTHSTNAFIVAPSGSITRIHTTDALAVKSATKTHTTNAIKLKLTTKTHTTNAFIGGTRIVQHDTVAWVKGISIKRTHSTDAYITGAAGAGGWQIDLYGATGSLASPVVTNANFKSASITWSLDGAGAAQVELIEDDTAANWLSGRRRVTFARGGARLFTGYLTQVSAQSQGRPHVTTYTMSLMGLRSILEYRVVHGDFNEVAKVASVVAWDLIAHANTQESMGFSQGITVGTGPTVTRFYCDGDVISESIDELAQRDADGFDWEINADGKFNVWVGGRGTDKSATYTIALNDTTTDAIQWREQAETSDVPTYVTAMGTDPDGPCGPPLTVQNLDMAGYARREVVVSGEHNTQEELEDAALDELKARQKARYRLDVTWHVDDLPWPFGPTGVWLGDSINVTPNIPFGTTQKMRLIQVDLSLEKGATEWMTYTFEAT